MQPVVRQLQQLGYSNGSLGFIEKKIIMALSIIFTNSKATTSRVMKLTTHHSIVRSKMIELPV
jgi:hypothetical protein